MSFDQEDFLTATFRAELLGIARLIVEIVDYDPELADRIASGLKLNLGGTVSALDEMDGN
jgi:hypothetical protein